MRRWPRTRFILLGLLVALQVADFLLTWLLLAGGPRSAFYEANPLARIILARGDWAGLALFKVTLTALALGATLYVARHRPGTAHRLLAGLCVLVFLVVAQGGHLLAVSSDPDYQRVRTLEEEDVALTGQLHALSRFVKQRDAILLDLLESKGDSQTAMAKVVACINTHRPHLNSFNQKHLPATSRTAHVASYMYFHLAPIARRHGREAELRAFARELTGRFPGTVLLEPGTTQVFELPWRQ